MQIVIIISYTLVSIMMIDDLKNLVKHKMWLENIHFRLLTVIILVLVELPVHSSGETQGFW